MNLKEKAIDKIKYDGLKFQTLADKWKNDLDVVSVGFDLNFNCCHKFKFSINILLNHLSNASNHPFVYKQMPLLHHP